MSADGRHVEVDRSVCVGSSWCVNLAAGAFVIDPSDGKSRVANTDGVTADELAEAIESCPVGAISFVGDAR